MKAALYIRVSTTYQIDKDSLPVQRQDLINYAKYAFNIDDYEIFEDAGFSGKNTNRPAFQEMMERIRNKEFSHLFVWKIDRVSRNLLDFCDMYEELKKYDCTFISKNEQFDTSSAMGEAMLKIILVFAELERKLTSERVTSIMLARAERGMWNGANVPLGYDYDEETKYPVINESEAKTIHLIFDMYEDVKSTVKISNFLNDNNIATKRGGTWTSKTVGDILHNPFYYGTLRYNYRESGRGKKKSKDEWVIKEDNHIGIISKDQWNRCNKIIEFNSKRNSARWRQKNYVQHIFGGLLVCKDCSRKFEACLDRARSDGYRPTRYVCGARTKGGACHNKMSVSDVSIGDFVLHYVLNFIKSFNVVCISSEALESLLLSGDLFEDVLLTEDSIRDTFIAINYFQKTKQDITYEYNNEKEDNVNNTFIKHEHEKITSSLNNLERAKERLINLYLYSDHDMDENMYYEKKNDIDKKIKELKNKLETLEIKNNLNCDTDFLFIDNMNDFLFNLNINLDNNTVRELTLDGGRKILKDFFSNIIDRIIISNARVDSIVFKNGLTHTFIYKK